MNRRSSAITLSVVLLLMFATAGFFLDVPYVKLRPGPTANVIGDDHLVQVSGHKSYPTDGELRFTTVRVTGPEYRLTVLDAMVSWLDQDEALIPREAYYTDDTTTEQERAESAAQMVSSQDTAIAAALRELGYELPTYPEVTSTTPGAPADGKLKPRDRILEINGKRVTDTQQVYDAVGELEPGDTATVKVRRGRDIKSYSLTTVPSADNPDRAMIGIFLGTGYTFPFDVTLDIDPAIGGPSAGLVFALAVYDTLTPGAMTGGLRVAGTGSIDADGRVGPIGGIQQKIVSAQEAGAQLFLVPADNCASALEAHLTTDIELVRAPTLHSAVRSIERYAADPDADLPTCRAEASS